MKLNKLEGIKFLEAFQLPTIKRLDVSKIINATEPIKEGISLRTSPRNRKDNYNVYLPSIHHCKNIQTIKDFVRENENKYEIFAHQTVKPETIGSLSKLSHIPFIVIETYQNFEKRKQEEIDNRVTIPVVFDKVFVSRLTLLKEKREDFLNFCKVIQYIKDIPFQEYDMEYVIEKGEVIFTDLTLPNDKEYFTCKNRIDQKETVQERE